MVGVGGDVRLVSVFRIEFLDRNRGGRVIVKELWPGAKGPETAILTGDDGQDVSTFDAVVAVVPKGQDPVDGDWITPGVVGHPSASVITAEFTLDEETLSPAVRTFNVWIKAFSGTTQIVPRVAAQLKRARI